LATTSSRELTEYRALYELEPWGEDRDDWRVGQLTALVSNLFREKGAKPRPAGDFMWVTLTAAKPKQSGQEILDHLRAVAIPKRVVVQEREKKKAKLEKLAKQRKEGKD